MVKPRQGSKFYSEISPFIHLAVHVPFLYLKSGLDHAEMNEVRSLPANRSPQCTSTFRQKQHTIMGRLIPDLEEGRPTQSNPQPSIMKYLEGKGEPSIFFLYVVV